MNARVKAFALLAFFALVSPVLSDQSKWLGVAELKAAFAGRTLTGNYADGFIFTETYAQDGRISYWDPQVTTEGRWHVSTDQGFCTFYDNLVGGCFKTLKVGDNCFQFFLLEAQDSGPLPKGKGTPYISQGWYPDKPSTCEALTG